MSTTDFLCKVADTSYTVPANVTSITLEIWEPGAGGAGASTNASGGGGGGGGAYAKWTSIPVTPAQVLTVSIVAGGTGGAAAAAGVAPLARSSVTIGGTTYFVSSSTAGTWAQPGGHGTNGAAGTGGVPNPSPAAAVSNTGGAGAAGVGASDHGGGGGSSAGQAATGNAASGLTGGAAPDSSSGAGGNGGNNAVGTAPTAGNSLYDGGGSNAPNPGGGGGGGGRTTASHAGAAGAVGGVAITYTPVYLGPPLGWSNPAGVRATYVRTGLAMASQIPLPASSSPVILTTSLPGGIISRSYTATLSASGGTPAYTWSISAGSLPAGLSLNSSTGVISGTPTGPPGTTSFTVKVTDSLSNTATQPLSITIIAAPVTWYAPIRTRITPPPRGRIGSNPGGPVRNPVPPLAVRLPHGPVQARLPYPRRGQARFMRPAFIPGQPSQGPPFTQRTSPVRVHPVLPPRGRIGSNPGTLVIVPRPPKAYPLQGPVRARTTPPFSKGRAYSHPGAPLRNPNAGPAFRQAVHPARAVIPQAFSKGRISSNAGAPLRNPGAGPTFRQAVRPAQARVPQVFSKGRIGSNPGGPVRNPVVVPVTRQQQAPSRAKLPRPLTGRIYGISQGHPAVIPAPVYPLQGPVRARIPQAFSKGRASGSPGAPLRNPGPGPVFRPAVTPARTRIILPPRGRIRSNPGTPFVPPVPPVVAPFTPRTFIRARLPLPLRGTCRTVRLYPLPSSPGSGPAFTQAVTPARARVAPPPRGRAGSNPGGPIPPPPIVAPFRQEASPARIRPGLPLRGRVSFNPGAPLRNPDAGPVFRQAVQPARIRITLPPRGRITSSPRILPPAPPPVQAPSAPRGFVRAKLPPAPRGTCRTVRVVPLPVPPVLVTAPFYPKAQPVRAPIPQRTRGGQIGSNPGGPLRNPGTGPQVSAGQPAGIRVIFLRQGDVQQTPPYAAPPAPPIPAKVYPAQGPVRIRPTLPPRGRIASGKGAPARNPNPGPVFRQAVKPTRGIIPQNAPRGRTSGNPGGPVENIPFATLRFRTGSPYFQWATEDPGFRWDTSSPGFQWATGDPEAG